uniref:Uncharacterized protein n=1 Tax=Anguilla anguilla TaxID=7936 RepID=A0A0E9TWZ5_ANGAN
MDEHCFCGKLSRVLCCFVGLSC